MRIQLFTILLLFHPQKDPALWRICFFVSAGIFFFGNLIFIIFGKGSIQSWNNVNKAGTVNDAHKSRMCKYFIYFEVAC